MTRFFRGLTVILFTFAPATLAAQRVVPFPTWSALTGPYTHTTQSHPDLAINYPPTSDARSGLKVGLALGVLFGGIFGGLYGNTSCHVTSTHPCTGATVGGVAIGAVVGGGLGAIVGSMFDGS
jgi:hypothetical protein